METLKLRNGYLQPETEPTKTGKVLVITLSITALLFAILQTCIL